MDARTPDEVVSAQFAGSAGTFFGLIVRGSLLQVPTFGFYRFWLLTDVRRHLWSNTRVGDESLEYTGLARELLVGFLIALAILLPIYLIYFLIGLEAERLKAFASIPLLFLLYVFSRYAAFRARRYRATRTIFRGVRFWMTGSGWAYAGLTVLWDALTVLTIGLALPWRAAALERYQMKHTFYGDLPGSFVGTGWTFFKRGWWLWLICLLIVVLGIASTSAMVVAAVNTGSKVSDVLVSLIPFFLMVGFGLFVWPLLRAIQLRWRFDNIRFEDVAFQCNLAKGAVFKCYLIAWLAGLVFLVAIIAVIGMVIGLGAVTMRDVALDATTGSIAIIVATVGAYLLTVLTLTVLKLQFLDRGVWAATVNSLTILNLAGIDAVVARGAAAGSVGEGLADALDFGGGL